MVSAQPTLTMAAVGGKVQSTAHYVSQPANIHVPSVTAPLTTPLTHKPVVKKQGEITNKIVLIICTLFFLNTHLA